MNQIPFYMDQTTAAGLLKQSREFTAAKRQAKQIAEVKAQFERIGWKPEAAQELAEIHVRGVAQ